MKIDFQLSGKSRWLLPALLFLVLHEFAMSQSAPVQGANALNAVFRGKTRPLRELAPMPATPGAKRNLKKSNKPDFTPPNFANWRRQPAVNPDALPQGIDPARQDNLANKLSSPVEPRLVLEGIDEATSEVGVPDTNGDVGPDHYVQIINASWFQVFAKDGTALTPPTSANTIWSQINKQSFSDPVIMYDEDAARWLLTDLAGISEVLYGISETSDPLGAWNLYTLNTPGFADYPKYGVFPEAYVLTINEGQGAFPVYALNRQQMLAGASTVSVQRVNIPGLQGGFPTATPMDWNSPLPPPSNEVHVVRLNDDAWGNNPTDVIEVWTIDIDWANASNTSASSVKLPCAPYDTDGCVTGTPFDYQCLPQPGTSQGIDGIMTIIMNNVAYRNFGSHESAVLCFTVDAGTNQAGIRWMELRRTPGNDWALHQEGTYAPADGIHRFIGGISINAQGDIGLAYSVTSDTGTYPGLRFTGRRAYDTPGTMTVDEFEFAPGAGARESDRYGDYARMTVDPADDSFWFTSEYVKADGSYGTKIVNFSLRKDTLDVAPVALLSPQNSPDLGSAETVTIRVRNTGLEPVAGFSVGYIFQNNTPVLEPANLPAALLPDSSYTHTFTPAVNMSAVGEYQFKVFTVFAQDQNTLNDTLRQIRRKLPRFDSGITGATGLDVQICDPETDITLSLTNFGTEMLTSATIQYQVNGGVAQNQNWTGNIAPGASATVNLTLSGLVSGVNTLAARTLNPNGIPDEIPSNDNYSRSFQVLLGGKQVTLTLKLDEYPTETSWQLKDESGNVVFSGDDYLGAGATVTETWCLDSTQCYTFIILDSYGDGLIEGNGSYSIKDADGNVLASIIQVNFGSKEENKFCLTAPCSFTVDIDVTNAGPAGGGAILITPVSGVAPFQYSKNGGVSFQNENLFENLAPGVYKIVVKDANDCLYEQNVTVQSTVAVGDPQQQYSILVAPNPAPGGVFQVTIEGLPGDNEVGLQIVDAAGRPVSYETLPGVDGHFQGMVSLRAFPAGVYYLRVRSNTVSQLVKVIKL